MIHLDTSVLIDALSGQQRSAAALREAIVRGERVQLSAIALYESLRGPRLPPEIAAEEVLFPADTAVGFGAEEARRSAELYRRGRPPRGREIDLAVAACALTHDAVLWTLEPDHFADIPDLRLYDAHGQR